MDAKLAEMMIAADRQTIEIWGAEKRTPDWLFAATKALKGWAIGQEVSEEDYDLAVLAAANVQMGYPDRFVK